MLGKLFDQGINIFRINCGHCSFEEARKYILNIRTASKKKGIISFIILDLAVQKLIY